jgi:hypothetical protein
MKQFMAVLLSVIVMVAGCKTHQSQPVSIFRQPNWWERRMDRLETWDVRHGRPVEKTKEAIIITTAAVGITVGFAAAVVAGCALESWLQEQGGPKNYYGPETDPPFPPKK